jgi:hypothetical protein
MELDGKATSSIVYLLRGPFFTQLSAHVTPRARESKVPYIYAYLHIGIHSHLNIHLTTPMSLHCHYSLSDQCFFFFTFSFDTPQIG